MSVSETRCVLRRFQQPLIRPRINDQVQLNDTARAALTDSNSQSQQFSGFLVGPAERLTTQSCLTEGYRLVQQRRFCVLNCFLESSLVANLTLMRVFGRLAYSVDGDVLRPWVARSHSRDPRCSSFDPSALHQQWTSCEAPLSGVDACVMLYALLL